MKKYIKILAVVVVNLMVVSCAQDNLEYPQHGTIPVDETYANADDATAQELVGNIYTTARSLLTGDWGIHYVATNAVKVADFWPGGSDSNDGGDYQKMAAMIDDAENGAYKDMYTRFYKIMYKANMIVDQLNNGSDERKRVIAEAKAWRAWAMMRLTQLWGSAPLVEHRLDGVNYPYDPANTDPKVSWAWVAQQFKEAATALPSKSGLGGQRAIGGRWTAEACYAFSGQAYMWQGDYANAKTELAKVIKSGKYDLWKKTASMATYDANINLYRANKSKPGMTWIDGNPDYKYLTLFRAEADFCDEYILELDTDGDATTITNTEPYWFWAYMGWRNDQINTPANSSKNDGWGFINPTLNFGLAFSKHDGNSIRRRMSVATFNEVYYDFPYLDNSVRGIMGGKKLYANQGYFRMKYYNFVDDLDQTRYANGQANGNRTNFPLMRYSNVLLLYAEAVFQSGSEGDAGISGLGALNEVRRRAGLTDAPALDMNNPDYGIKAERRFELCLEDCDRYVDLIRWGDYKTFVLDTSEQGVGEYWGTKCAWFEGFVDPSKGRSEDPTDLSNYKVRMDPLSTRGSWNDRLYLWPFPYAEISTNGNLVQNPGW